jgi:hypothetical protein
MTEQFWADGATRNCVWVFQTKLERWCEKDCCQTSEWHTEMVFLTREEAMRHGEARPYAWGDYKKGWRIWGVPCEGLMAEILGAHNVEFESKVEYITKKVAKESLNEN